VITTDKNYTAHKINMGYTNLFHFPTCFCPSEPSSGRTISLEITEVLNSYILRLQEVYTAVISGSIFLPEYVTARRKHVEQ
jgi:hypothetical protein